MEIKLKLFNKIGIFENKTVRVPKNEKLKVLIEGKLINGLTYIAKYDNIETEIKNKEFEVELSAGCYSFMIYAVKGGDQIKSWSCDDLIVNELNDANEVRTEIGEVLREVERLRQSNTDLKEKVCELEKKCDNTLEVVMKLNGLKKEID